MGVCTCACRCVAGGSCGGPVPTVERTEGGLHRHGKRPPLNAFTSCRGLDTSLPASRHTHPPHPCPMCCVVAGTGRGVEGGGGGLQLQRRRRGGAAAQDTRHLRQVGASRNHTAYTDDASHRYMVGFKGVLSSSCPSLFCVPMQAAGQCGVPHGVIRDQPRHDGLADATSRVGTGHGRAGSGQWRRGGTSRYSHLIASDSCSTGGRG